MKTYLKYMIAAFVLPLVFACQEKEPDTPPVVEPVFPEFVKNTEVKPGEELEFVFTPNMDWEISLSEGSFEYFKLLEDNGRQREKLTGKASACAEGKSYTHKSNHCAAGFGCFNRGHHGRA